VGPRSDKADMPDPISNLTMHLEPGSAPQTRLEQTPEPERSFAETLEEAPDVETPVADAVRDMASSLVESEQRVDRALRAARRGRELDPAHLLALQAGVYRYAQEMELASKLVDKATGAVKQVLQSQQ